MYNTLKYIFQTFNNDDNVIWEGGKQRYVNDLYNRYKKRGYSELRSKVQSRFYGLFWKITRRKIYKETQPAKWNIYNIKTTLGEYYRQWHLFHMVFKTKFFVPIIRLTKHLMGKMYVKRIPDEPHYKILKVWERAFERAFSDWKRYYQMPYHEDRKDRTKIMKSFQTHHLNDLKNLVNTFVTKDTAYFEFFNVLMIVIAQEMCEEFKNTPLLKHVMYHKSTAFDVSYYIIHQTLAKNKDGKYNNIKITMEPIPA